MLDEETDVNPKLLTSIASFRGDDSDAFHSIKAAIFEIVKRWPRHQILRIIVAARQLLRGAICDSMKTSLSLHNLEEARR